MQGYGLSCVSVTIGQPGGSALEEDGKHYEFGYGAGDVRLYKETASDPSTVEVPKVHTFLKSL